MAAIFLVLLGGIAVTLFAVTVVVLNQKLTRKWQAQWRGHTLELVAQQNQKELFVDGKRIASKMTLSGFGAMLSGSIEEPGGAVVTITAKVSRTEGNETAGRIYVNGEFVGGSARDAAPPLASRASATPADGAGGADGAGAAATNEAPSDERWPAAALLLDELQRRNEPRLDEAADRLRAVLRDLFSRLRALAAATSAHEKLGGGKGALEQQRVRLEEHLHEALDSLRELHVLALATEAPPSLDRVEDVVRDISAEQMVEDELRRSKAEHGKLTRRM